MAASQGVPDLDKGLCTGQVLDLSNQTAVKKWLEKFSPDDRVQRRLASLQRAYAAKEVLVAWRGHLPRSLFEIVDDYGHPLMFLDDGCFST